MKTKPSACSKRFVFATTAGITTRITLLSCNQMISVTDAIKLIRENTYLLPSCSMPLHNAGGCVLAADLYANINIPGFRQSAMDGYAFRFSDLERGNEFTINGEVAAGDNQDFLLQPSGAIRIFTGAALPEDCDTVVMQEKTETEGAYVIINDDQLIQGRNVRREGSEIKKGELALPTGTQLTPAAIGFLASLGVSEVKVYPTPIVSIIITGNELQKPGVSLKHGQVYESNSVMLETALKQLGISNTNVIHAKDDLNGIINTLHGALEKADIILLTGGVSVGKYDFVVQAAEACGVQQLFHKVAQRPGKPIYAGKKENKIVFGLPGNPASVLTCFFNYVVAALESFTGRKEILQRKFLPLTNDFSKKVKLTQFLKAVYNQDGVNPLPAQESFRLSSFSLANCLVILPEEKMEFAKGELVETLLLPYL